MITWKFYYLAEGATELESHTFLSEPDIRVAWARFEELWPQLRGRIERVEQLTSA